MNIRPLHDRVLVKRLGSSETTIGSIVIPDSAQEKPQQAEVIAAGSGRMLRSGERAEMNVKAGDRILFGKYSGAEVRIGQEEYLVLKEDEILAVLD
jgi:chaperonin GroES